MSLACRRELAASYHPCEGQRPNRYSAIAQKISSVHSIIVLLKDCLGLNSVRS
jgi:hypothetical protein